MHQYVHTHQRVKGSLFLLCQYLTFYFPVKQLTTETDNRTWYEKLEDYEGDFESVEEDGERGKKNNGIQVLYNIKC